MNTTGANIGGMTGFKTGPILESRSIGNLKEFSGDKKMFR